MVKDDLSIIKNILRYTQKKYNITDKSYIDDVIVPKKATTIEEVKAKRENYLLNGMRIGELLAIQPENIDFKNKKLIIDGTIHWRKEGNNLGFKDTTKTALSYRTISLTTRSCDILRKVMLENKKAFQWKNMYVDRDFIFTNHKGNPISLTSINRNIQIAAKNVGIKKHITSHTMRHSHISLLSQLGISLRAIMDRVGHTDHKTTLQIYSHVTEQMDKDMMSKLEKVGIN